MADALVSIAVKKLTEVVGQELSLFAGATHELEKLSHTFRSIQVVLDDAESRQVGDESVQLWLSRLRHVAYDIEDLVEDGQISSLGDKEGNEDDDNSRNKRYKCVPFCHNRSDYAVSRYNIANGIKEIKERLDQIDVERNRYGFSSSPLGGDHRTLVRSQRITTSLMDESDMVIGRENDKETMISRLVSESSSNENQGQVQVVSITSIGGLGKTTLARQIYHDGKVQDHFNKAVYWVCVSDVFDVIGLTRAILEQVKGTNKFPSELDALQKELLEALRGKRFLLVLDDVWNDDADKWEMLRLPFTSGANGSRILVTTRSEKVANTMNANYIHDLKGLSDDQSWTLFSSRAFAGKREGDCSEFESIGKGIAGKCKGVPLAIKVIGSAMKTKRTVQDWKNVLESKIWSLRQATDKILPALLLTYCHLPAHLKQCFSYCSIFPKDWEFQKDVLVRLWVAQGFIQSEGNREKEDIGDEYFDELVAWSMFQEINEDSKGKITCKMHDLLHDLAELIAKDEIYSFISKSKGGKSEECSGSSGDIRHAFLSFGGNDDKIPLAAHKAKRLRTLWLLEIYKLDSGIIDLIHEARFLRALYLSYPTRLPKNIGKLKHLRYLHLTGSNIVKLPESIGCLRNLHTLNLNNCNRLKKLPRGIGGMVSLRHLEIEGTDSLKYLPKGLGRISGLRSLRKFIVGGKGGCRINELQGLNSLQGSLQIEHLERVSSREEAERAQLWNKSRLRRLVLRMSEGRGGDAETERMDSVLEGLRPHGNLEELELYFHNISKLPSRMREEGASFFPNLTLLVISGFIHCESVPGLGKLPALKYLRISWAGVKKVGHEFCYGFNHSSRSSSRRSDVVSTAAAAAAAFPKLKAFMLSDMSELEEWELPTTSTSEFADVIIMPCLHQLALSGCPKLERLPNQLTRTPLKRLSIERCPRSKGIESSSSFPLLESFTLDDSSEFFSTGPLPHLPNLKQFFIDGMRKETLPDEGWEQLAALWYLEIKDCRELKCLPEGLTQLPSLESLYISSCNKLESVPEGLGQLKKLKSLTIGILAVLPRLPDSLGQLESLQRLQISYCEKLESLPQSLGQLKKLKLLQVNGSEVLTSLPNSLGQLESLERLQINSCKKLESLPQSLGQLKKLNSFKVNHLEMLRCLPDSLGQLQQLNSLEVGGSEVLMCLPDSLGQLVSLERLQISSCKKLESLPQSLGQLKALNYLVINDCKALGSLPHGLQRLSLRELEIYNCRLLSKRCKRERGEDWPKISHIPKIQINGKLIIRQ